MTQDPSMPTPEKEPGRDQPDLSPLDGAVLGGTAGARFERVSSLQCSGMGKEDLRFLIETFGERVVPDEGFEELWAWVTTAPHDTLFARAPLDETLLGLASPTAGWEVGRRTVEGMVEYFATLRVERGVWSGLSITVSHFEGTSDGDRVLFSASVGRLVDGSPECRQARVERLLRLCGLTDCKAGGGGSDLIGRSSTLADSGEFCLFCG